MEAIRAFLAIRVPRETADAIRGLVSRLKPRLPEARFVGAHQWHLTLHFFAALSPDEVDRVREAGRGATATLSTFLLSFRGLGAFPDAKRARVLWLGVGEGARECAALHERLRAALRGQGLWVEERPFQPHLTLARFRQPRPGGIVEELRRWPGHEVAAFLVERVTLFRSVLTSLGAEHTVLDEFPLGGATGGGGDPGEAHGGP